MPSKRSTAAAPTPPETPPGASLPKKTGRLSAFLGSQPGTPSRAPLVPPSTPPDPWQIDLVDAVTPGEPVPDAPTPTTAPVTARTRRAERAPRRTRSGREQLLVYMHREGIKELKRAVLDDLGDNVSDLVCEAVNEWLLKHKRPPVA